MKNYLVLVAFLFACSVAHSQSKPSSFTSSVKHALVLEMRGIDNAILLAKELDLRKPGRANQFAVAIPTDVRPQNQGTWEYTQDGKAIWRLRIVSKHAHSINLGFDRFILPPEGELFIYDLGKTQTYGPFVDRQNNQLESLWSPIVKSDHIVVELQVNQGNESDVDIHLSSINHDFEGFESTYRSGSCNVDIVCSATDGFPLIDRHRDIIQSAAWYTLNGIETCSGALINNTSNDKTPYFLTADHCGISSGNDQTMVLYWNYFNSTCRTPNGPASGQPGDGSLADFNTGAILRANYGPSDFALVEVADPLSPTSAAYFAGWNRADGLPDSTICIHHPNTDEKRISFDYDPAVADGATHIRVEDWDVGTTEGGSSGSPLFDQDKRIIGQLTGGFAACGNDLWDSYGWLNVSWEGGNTPDSRLKDWLDPMDSGVESIPGISQTFSIVVTPAQLSVCAPGSGTINTRVSDQFTGNVVLTINGFPPGVTGFFNMNPIAPGDSTSLSLTFSDQALGGTYTLTITAADGGGNVNTRGVQINISNGLPDAPMHVTPIGGMDNVSTFAGFEWSGAGNIYHIQIAGDDAFNDIVYEIQNATNTNVSNVPLSAGTSYYWRVRASNLCGDGDWSEASIFMTAFSQCMQNTAQDLPY